MTHVPSLDEIRDDARTTCDRCHQKYEKETPGRAGLCPQCVKTEDRLRSHMGQRCRVLPIQWSAALILTASVCFADIAKPAPKFLPGPTNAPTRKPFAKCTGEKNCQACTSCSGCKHCHANGGTCGKKGGAK